MVAKVDASRSFPRSVTPMTGDDDPLLLARKLMTAVDWTRASAPTGGEYLRRFAEELTEHPCEEPGAATLLGRTVETDDPEGRRDANRAGALFGQGRDDEALKVLAELRPRLETEPAAASYVTEVLVTAGRPETALEWLTVAVRGLLGRATPDFSGGETPVLVALGTGRYRLRRELGLPPDEYDTVLDRLGDPSGDVGGPGGAVTVYWPRAEFEALLRRWPELAEVYGEDWQEHRAGVQAALEARREAGESPLWLVAASVEGLTATSAFVDAPPTDPDVREQYETEAADLGESEPWPPAADAPCWCRSGRPYGQCCRPRGLR